jgi:hypothetical protein
MIHLLLWLQAGQKVRPLPPQQVQRTRFCPKQLGQTKRGTV